MKKKERDKKLLDVHKRLIEDQKEINKIADGENLNLNMLSDWTRIYSDKPAYCFDDLLRVYNIQGFEVPCFDYSPVESLKEKLCLENLKDLDESVFAQWRVNDVPAMFFAGIAGAGASYLFKEKFDNWHKENWSNKHASEGGHFGEDIDIPKGAKRGGGIKHRWDKGHDILNPYDPEIDWTKYSESLGENGKIKIIYYWIRHLLQDAFSTIGLPLPGHSHLRPLIDWLYEKKLLNYKLLNKLATIKARDLAGAGLTNAIMGLYLWGTEESLARVITKANYRAFSLMAGANLTNLLVGLTMPTPTLNWSCVPPVLYYGGRMIWLYRKIEIALAERSEAITRNQIKLDSFESRTSQIGEVLYIKQQKIDKQDKLLKDITSTIDNIHSQVLDIFDKESEWAELVNKLENIESEEEILSLVSQECADIIKE